MTSTRTRIARFVAFAVVASLMAAASPAVGAQTQPLPPKVSHKVIAEAEDYASLALANPWEMSAEVDLPIIDGLNHKGFTNVRFEQGRWKGTAEPQAYIRPIQSWNAIPNGRDGQTTPIDADHYTHFSIRMRMTGAPSTAAQVSWYDCGQLLQECRGAMGFRVNEGWHTYVMRLENDPTKGPVEWAGEIRGLVVTPTARGGDIEIDFIRLYKPETSGVRVLPREWSPGTTLYWDRDRLPSNNTPDNPSWGVLSETGDAVRFDTDSMAAGWYFVYTVDADGVRSKVRRIIVNRRPRPQVIQPDALGGASYDELIRGDAWDYTTASDVDLTRNMSWTLSDGMLVGTNTSPDLSDSGFRLPLVANQPIDGSRFTNFSARVFYEGGFGLTADSGGGMNARLVWRTTAGEVRVSDDIVVSPGWNTITIDLDGLTPNELVEGGAPRAWDGQQIELVRFDPHEDEGARRFFVDWIRIAENDKPRTDGTFRIVFRDAGFEKLSRAVVRLTRNDDGTGGQIIANRSVRKGKNAFNWTVPSNLVGSGEWYVTVEITDSVGSTTTAVSTGSIDL